MSVLSNICWKALHIQNSKFSKLHVASPCLNSLTRLLMVFFSILVPGKLFFFVEFFKKYVKSNPKKAVIFKGGAKLSPAFDLWNDEYLKNHPESEKMEFDVEVGKKETRQGKMEKRSVKNFIETFRKDDIYAVTDVPQQLK